MPLIKMLIIISSVSLNNSSLSLAIKPFRVATETSFLWALAERLVGKRSSSTLSSNGFKLAIMPCTMRAMQLRDSQGRVSHSHL